MRIYMDYNATRPLRENAKNRVCEILSSFGNSSSVHKEGRAIKSIVESCRHTISNLMGISAERIFFTSGATESNNTIVKSFKDSINIISNQEHPSVYASAHNVVEYNTDKHGVCDLNHLEELLKKHHKDAFVSMISANNETGVIQPVEDAQSLSKQYGAYFHTDAVQAIGRSNIDWKKFDFITFSGHKIGALQGIGVAIIPEKFPLQPLLHGGGQEKSLRSGTENAIGVASLDFAIQEAMIEKWDNAKQKKDLLEKTLQKKFPEVIIFGQKSERLGNTSLIAMPNVQNDIQVINFDLNGISLSAGSACSSGKVRKSKLFEKLGYPEELSSAFIRISLMPDVTNDDIHKFISSWGEIYQQCSKQRMH